jgi:small conductance mechanosensitive channel
MEVKNWIEFWYNGLISYLPNLALGLTVLMVGWILIGKLVILVNKGMTKRELDPTLTSFMRSLISVSLRILLLVSVADILGIETASLVTLIGAAGLAIGLSLQGALQNFAGGVLVLFFKPYRVGHKIEINGFKGVVTEIQILNTILETAEKNQVIIPNRSVSNSTLVNYSTSAQRVVAVVFDWVDDGDWETFKKKLVVAMEGITNRPSSIEVSLMEKLDEQKWKVECRYEIPSEAFLEMVYLISPRKV